VTAVTWATRAVMAVIAAAWAVIGAIAVRDWLRGGKRDMDQALALVCKPCHGEEGPHTCGRKLPGPGRPQASGAGRDDDTGVMTIDDEYRALLDKEGGR
jgi:hypothetical protein